MRERDVVSRKGITDKDEVERAKSRGMREAF